MPGFNIVWGFQPDYMHCVLLGVAHQFAELWLSRVGIPFYIEHPYKVAAIDNHLCSIFPPWCFARLIRSIKLRKYWKVTE